MIWLIDYNHYTKEINSELYELRQGYFAIKRFARYNKIGITAPVKPRTFSNGLLRIATILAKNGFDVKYLHFYMLDDMLSGGDVPDIVAFSAVCPTVPRAAKLAERIKERYPSVRIVIGGAHVNQVAEETIKRFPIFDEAIEDYELAAASAIVKEHVTAPHIYVDYCLLPFPITEYSINTFVAAGCPFQCDYCVDGTSPHFIAMPDGQISILQKLLPKRTLVHFFDSCLGYGAKGASEICNRLKKTGHEFILSCDMRADLITPDLLWDMESAGFREIRLGLDTASETILKRNHRTIMPKKLVESLHMIRDNSNLYIALYTITGLPGTTREQHKITLDAIREIHRLDLADEIKSAIYVPYPMKNTDYASRGVYIKETDWSQYDRSSFPVFELDGLSRENIWELFIETAQCINESWLGKFGFGSTNDIPQVDSGYFEYIESNYIKPTNGERDETK